MTTNTQDLLAARYYELCDQRDAVNAESAPIQEKLDAANAKVQKAQAEATALAAQIQALRGGQKWLDLKKEIGTIANALRRIPARPAAK